MFNRPLTAINGESISHAEPLCLNGFYMAFNGEYIMHNYMSNYMIIICLIVH